MEIRQLRYFVAIVEAKSMTGAAARLNVVQSALSHQIAKLEEELGEMLLDRGKSGVTPTAAGTALYTHALSILKGVEDAKQAVVSEGQSVRGAVSIGLPSGIVPALAIPLLRAVGEQFPEVQLTIIESMSSITNDMLLAGRLDLAILFVESAPRGVVHVPLVSEALHFVTSDREWKQIGKPNDWISLRDLARQRLLLPPEPTSLRLLLERECMRAGLVLDVRAQLSGVDTSLAAVRLNLGSTVMMAVTIPARSRRGLKVVPIRHPEIRRHAGICNLHAIPLTQAASHVRQLVISLVAAEVASGRWPGATLL